MLTIKAVNKAIQAKHPHVELVKGKGYYYIASDHEATALKLAGLYTTSIPVYSLNHMPLEKWLTSVDSLLNEDENRGYGDQGYFD